MAIASIRFYAKLIGAPRKPGEASTSNERNYHRRSIKLYPGLDTQQRVI